mgnify:FL=1
MRETANELSFGDLHVGMQGWVNWTATVEEIDRFAALSGDKSPLHMNQKFAQEQGFRGRITHGFLLGAKLSYLAGMELPGKNSILVEQKLSFHQPVFAGDQINLSVKIVDMIEDFNFVVLKFRAVKYQANKTLLMARGEVTCKMLS